MFTESVSTSRLMPRRGASRPGHARLQYVLERLEHDIRAFGDGMIGRVMQGVQWVAWSWRLRCASSRAQTPTRGGTPARARVHRRLSRPALQRSRHPRQRIRRRGAADGGSTMKLHASLLLSLLVCTGSVAAQGAPHVCGAGPGPNEVQAGVQPGGNGMAPTPLCYWKSQPQQQQQPPQPTGYWEKTWGAIAPSPVGGVLGTALGASSKEEAERLALEDCKAKGGGRAKLKLPITISALLW
jgi:hypothetical protein